MKRAFHWVFSRSTYLYGLFLISLAFAGLGIASPVFAASYTVCPSGCDFTTITDAAAVAVSPDIINVEADYASTTETFSFNLPNGVTLDCRNSGAVIGTDDENNFARINSQSNNIFRNCIFSNVLLENTGQSNVQILDNTWMGRSAITSNNASSILISGNLATGSKGLQNISVENSIDVTIASNTIMSYAGNGAVAGLRINHSTSISVTSNIIQDNTTTTNFNYDVIDFINGSFDIYFASNTVSEPFLVSFGNGMSFVQLSAQNVTIADNTFYMSGGGGGIGLNLNANTQDVSAVVRHNTYVLSPSCGLCNIIQPGAFSSNTVHVTSTYNLFVSLASSTANNTGHLVAGSGPAANLVVFTEYDGFSNLNTTNDPVNFPTGANAIIRRTNPLRMDDVISTNDYEQVPYSAFLDVNGTEDIGALSGVRGSIFYVDDTGAIDYISVDATNTTSIISNLRSNDTVNLAVGDYAPIVLVSSTSNVPLLSDISILGSGIGTLIHASSSGNALFVDGMLNSIFRDFTVTGASSTATSTYSITRSQFSDGVTDYDDGASIGAPEAVIVAGGVPSGGTCNTTIYSADGFDVTNIVAGATDDWNLFLIDYFGLKLTLLAPDRFVPDAAAALGCANPGDITVEHEVSSIYTVASGSYTYNAAAAALAGVSPKTGETNPPRLDRVIVGGAEAGVALDDSSDNLFVNVTSTGNSIGTSFMGSSSDNVFRDSTMQANAVYDIRSGASGDQTFIDSFLDIAYITGNGLIHGKFSARVLTQNSSFVGVEGITVNGVSANNASSTSFVTSAGGFSLFSNPLPAFTLSSSSALVTSGGFNPYGWTSVANSSYAVSAVPVPLTLPRQTIVITLMSTTVAGGGSGGGSILISQVPLFPMQPNLTLPLGLSIHDLVKLPNDGDVRTQFDSTVYYLGADGRRHAFPNPSVYASWYCDFSKVRIVSAQLLASIPLARNVTYRSGLRLVKFPSVPTVYVVQANRVLRGIRDEAMARQIAGNDWNKKVSDISEAFFTDYVIGSAITPEEAIYPEPLDRSTTYPSGSMLIPGYFENWVKQASSCPSS